ncbi:MAG: FprA family A-type flavoprotein [Clostridia bacterium]|nr:FprA family A-type flavoprotein [Clostridia bacterium]
MRITDDVRYIGVNDRQIDLFEGQYPVPDGMAYNSYVIIDEQIAVLDTVDIGFTDEWLVNLERELEGRLPDYLIIQHMEPDHSASIARFTDKYPLAKIVATAKAFPMIKGFFGNDYADRQIVAVEGFKLSLGKHNLTFITAPMVHWPEVMVTYDEYDKILFSADAFGKFGALDSEDDDWACEARRYYFGIVGKYGVQVQALLKKVGGLDIKTICSLHGPVLDDNLGYYIGLYNTWSSYMPEEDGVLVAYTSVYGNTRRAAKLLADKLEALGNKVVLTDLARCEIFETVEDAFRYSKLVLATTTYNGDIFPFMKQFIDHLTERNYSNRTVGLIENGSWAPIAAKKMREMFEKSKNINFTDTTVKITSALNDESMAALDFLAKELTN